MGVLYVQALQASLMAQEASLYESRSMEEKYKEVVTKLHASQAAASENLKVARDVQQDLDDFTVKVKATEEKMHEEAQKLITQHAMRARVETMMEYFKGEHLSWDMNETVRIYNEAYPDDAFPLHVPGGDEEVELAADDVLEDGMPGRDAIAEKASEEKMSGNEGDQKEDDGQGS